MTPARGVGRGVSRRVDGHLGLQRHGSTQV